MIWAYYCSLPFKEVLDMCRHGWVTPSVHAPVASGYPFPSLVSLKGERGSLWPVSGCCWAGASGCFSCPCFFHCALPSRSSPNQPFQESGLRMESPPPERRQSEPLSLPSVMLCYLTLSAHDQDYCLLPLSRDPTPGKAQMLCPHKPHGLL